MKWTTIVPVCLRESVLGGGPHPLRGMATPPPLCARVACKCLEHAAVLEK